VNTFINLNRAFKYELCPISLHLNYKLLIMKYITAQILLTLAIIMALISPQALNDTLFASPPSSPTSKSTTKKRNRDVNRKNGSSFAVQGSVTSNLMDTGIDAIAKLISKEYGDLTPRKKRMLSMLNSLSQMNHIQKTLFQTAAKDVKSDAHVLAAHELSEVTSSLKNALDPLENPEVRNVSQQMLHFRAQFKSRGNYIPPSEPDDSTQDEEVITESDNSTQDEEVATPLTPDTITTTPMEHHMYVPRDEISEHKKKLCAEFLNNLVPPPPSTIVGVFQTYYTPYQAANLCVSCGQRYGKYGKRVAMECLSSEKICTSKAASTFHIHNTI